MKIGINTIRDNDNYGNRLQNLALQETLISLGHEPVTIKNNYIYNVSSVPLLTRLSPSNIIDKIKRDFNALKYKRINQLRKDGFEKFTKKYINETENNYNLYTENNELNELFDCFVIGSDQVWNYNFIRFSEFDFLPFSKRPVISYAASFGVNEIKSEYEEMFQKGLSNIDYISVRETQGKNIVQKLVDRNVEVVLDPTLLLSEDRWNELADKSRLSEKNYILTYFLNDPKDGHANYIENFAKLHNYKIIKLGNIKESEYWHADPLDFLYLFKHAKAVFTDSFHACAFSIIFEKYFEVFERNTKMPSMNSRLDTLFSDLNLNDRWHSNNMELRTINYELAKDLLNNRRNESLNFLIDSLTTIEKRVKS